MTTIAGAGESYIKCDNPSCDSRVDTTNERIDGAPEGWRFVAIGTSKHLENADRVLHFCSNECFQPLMFELMGYGDA